MKSITGARCIPNRVVICKTLYNDCTTYNRTISSFQMKIQYNHTTVLYNIVYNHDYMTEIKQILVLILLTGAYFQPKHKVNDTI